MTYQSLIDCLAQQIELDDSAENIDHTFEQIACEHPDKYRCLMLDLLYTVLLEKHHALHNKEAA